MKSTDLLSIKWQILPLKALSQQSQPKKPLPQQGYNDLDFIYTDI